MPTLNEMIHGDRKQVNWLHSSYVTGTIFVDDSFQRRSVWVTKNKVRLIETVMKGFPMPEIYLWAGIPDPSSGASRFSVVDGQQRLRTLRDYISNAFPLSAEFLDNDVPAPSYVNKHFLDLSDLEKQRIWEYQLTTRTIPSHINRDQIVEMFLRLNETDKSLNPQELRNAEFNGEFIDNVEKIADLDFWTRHGVFNKAAARRMGDMQFVSSLLMFLRAGIETELTQAAINSMYDTYNETYPQKDADFSLACSLVGEVDRLFTMNQNVARFFRSPVHLYPLFVVAYNEIVSGRPINYQHWVDKLEGFVEAYRGASTDPGIAAYRLAATEGTQKRANREQRVQKLREWILS